RSHVELQHLDHPAVREWWLLDRGPPPRCRHAGTGGAVAGHRPLRRRLRVAAVAPPLLPSLRRALPSLPGADAVAPSAPRRDAVGRGDGPRPAQAAGTAVVPPLCAST